MENLDDLIGVKQTPENAEPRIGNGKAGPGRPKGIANKLTAKLRDAIETALDLSGDRLAQEAREAGKPMQHEGGAAAYLEWLSRVEPRAFATLVGKLIPTQLTGEGGGSIQFESIERRIVPAKAKP